MNAYTSKTRIQFGPNDYDMYSEDSNSTKLKEVPVTIPAKQTQAGGTSKHVDPTVVAPAAIEPQLNRN